MAGLHGVGGDARGFKDGGMDEFVVEDASHGVDGLGELALDEVEHSAGSGDALDAASLSYVRAWLLAESS